MLNQDTLREATRLTQAGQLTEATALLQRMFRGERAPAAASPAPGRIRLPGRTPPTIDLEANDVEADRAARTAAPTASPRRRRPLFDRAKDGTWLGLRGVKRAPASLTDIVPEGAKFIEGTYSNPAGSRTYKLFVPTGYQGQPLPLIVMLHGCTQSPDDFAAGTRMNFIAEEQNCLVVYPQGTSTEVGDRFAEAIGWRSKAIGGRGGAIHIRQGPTAGLAAQVTGALFRDGRRDVRRQNERTAPRFGGL